MNRNIPNYRSAILVAGVLLLFLPNSAFPQGIKDSAAVSGFLRDVAIVAQPQGVKVDLLGEGLPADFRNFPLSQPPRLVIDFPGVLSSFPKKFLEVGHPLLKDIRFGQHPDRLRLVLTFPGSGLPAYRIVREPGGVTILVGLFENDSKAEKKPEAGEKRETGAPQRPPEKRPSPIAVHPAKPAEELKPTPPPAKPEAEKPSAKVYSGEKITLDSIDADIQRVLALIAEAAGRPIVPSAEVRGAITLRLVDIPWDQALDAILSIYNLKKVEEGNLIRILPRDKS
jgi:hypothetical protein